MARGRQILALGATNVAGMLAVQAVGHVLGRHQMALHLDALLVLPPVLLLPPGPALALAAAFGLAREAATALPPGAGLAAYLAIGALLMLARPSLARGRTLSLVLLALGTNVALFAILGALRIPDGGWDRLLGVRAATDLALSTAVLLLVAPRWFLLHVAIQAALGDEERRGGR